MLGQRSIRHVWENYFEANDAIVNNNIFIIFYIIYTYTKYRYTL